MNRDFLCALSRGSDSSCGLKSQVAKDNEAGPSVDAREKRSVCQGAHGVLVAEQRTQRVRHKSGQYTSHIKVSIH